MTPKRAVGDMLRDLVFGARVVRRPSRDPLIVAMLKADLPRAFFTQKRTRSRAKAYRQAFRYLTPAQRKEAIERWGKP